MTTPTTPTSSEVDGSDEQSHDAMEIALGAAISALLLASLLPGPTSFLKGATGWANRVEAALGTTLRAFMQRSAMDLATATGRAGASTDALNAVDATYPKVLKWLQDASFETLQHVTDKDPEPDRVARDAAAAGENIARGASVYAKNLVREETVDKLGGALFKTWRTRHDDRVRHAHIELEGQRVPYSSVFHLPEPDGRTIRFPGDPDADLDLIAGCRCHLNYQFRPKERDFSDA